MSFDLLPRLRGPAGLRYWGIRYRSLVLCSSSILKTVT